MKLKVCGLKYPDNIKQVAELQPDFMGFIFYEGSRRFVGDAFVMPEINSRIKKVGVFVNASEAVILEKVTKYQLDLVQLHGNESPEFCAAISGSVSVIKAFGLDEGFDPDVLNAYKKQCAYFLFDTKTESYEGTGKPLNLKVLEAYDHEVPYFIGGGMDLEKFRSLSALPLNVFAADVNTKAEIKPGYKDIIKIMRVRNNIR